MQHATKPVPSLRQLNPDVPPRVERLVRRALAKEPERRFRSAREMELALRETAAILEAAELADPVAAGVIAPAGSGAASLAAEGDTTLPKPGRIRRIPPVIQTSPPARPRAAPESGEPSTWDDASLPSAVVAAYLPPTRHPAARARLAAVLAAALLLLAGIFLLVHGL